MTNEFSLRTRQRGLELAADSVFDVAVVGGGITGAGVVREAALRGWKALLLEKSDFASGTSSRSSKLIHGGVRYLAQGDVALVKEAARERAVLRRIAPHLVVPVRMLIPVHSRRAKLKMAAGLWTFDRLAGPRNDPHVVWDRGEVLTAEKGLRSEHLAGGIVYTEYITDDARLTLETVKASAVAGATVANYAEVTGIEEAGGLLRLLVEDGVTGERLVVRTRCLVNAAGPWFDRVRGLSAPDAQPLLQLTRGIHLVFRRTRLRIDHSVVLRAPDGRSTFVVPRGEYAYVGTTDTMYSGALEEPGVGAQDAAYLLECLRDTFENPPGPDDIVGTWSGVRPLLRQDGKRPSEISRRDEVHVGPGAVVAIAGGKLTTYRRMAERVLEKVEIVLGERRAGRVDSARMALFGGDKEAQTKARCETVAGLDAATEHRIWSTYGTAARDLLSRPQPRSAFEPIGTLPFTRAELDYAVDHEMVATLDDVLRRRTLFGLFDIEAATAAASDVGRALGERFGWSRERLENEVSRFARERGTDLEAVRSAGVRDTQ